MDLPFAPETALERRITADPVWRDGVAWGRPRPGHAEGAIVNHVAQLLANVDEQGFGGERREQLRLIALLHDAMKKRASGVGRAVNGHHGRCARRFAARHVTDPDLLDVIEWHDDAYRAWRSRRREARGRELIERLGDRLELFVDFYRVDNATESKSPEPLRWFERLAGAEGSGSARTRTSPDPPPRA